MSRVGLRPARTRRSVPDELRKPFEGKVLAVEGNESRVGSHQRIQRQEPKRGRRVDDDVIKLVAYLVDQRSEPLLAVREGHQFYFRTGEVAVGRQY